MLRPCWLCSAIAKTSKYPGESRTVRLRQPRARWAAVTDAGTHHSRAYPCGLLRTTKTWAGQWCHREEPRLDEVPSRHTCRATATQPHTRVTLSLDMTAEVDRYRRPTPRRCDDDSDQREKVLLSSAKPSTFRAGVPLLFPFHATLNAYHMVVSKHEETQSQGTGQPP